jgi:hypothetical protein
MRNRLSQAFLGAGRCSTRYAICCGRRLRWPWRHSTGIDVSHASLTRGEGLEDDGGVGTQRLLAHFFDRGFVTRIVIRDHAQQKLVLELHRFPLRRILTRRRATRQLTAAARSERVGRRCTERARCICRRRTERHGGRSGRGCCADCDVSSLAGVSPPDRPLNLFTAATASDLRRQANLSTLSAR